jgi:hypothetical protein
LRNPLPGFVSGGFPVFIDSQPLLGKRTARSRFEVAFKFAGPLPVSERKGGFDAPGAELRSVGGFASIVPAQPIPKVIGQANVEVFRVRLALQDVNVREFHF